MSRCAVIHLDSATDRLPLIEKLRTTLIHNLEVFSAKDGSDWEKNAKIAKMHPRDKTPVSRGILGCTHSHIDIVHSTLKDKLPFALIFEDDCEMLGAQDDIYGFLHRANHIPTEWDMILLGANEYVESLPPVGAYTQVKRFWGTHAVILKEKAMRAVLRVFADAQKRGEFLPADWMYNEAIRRFKLRVFGPSSPQLFFRQLPGLVSGGTGKIR